MIATALLRYSRDLSLSGDTWRPRLLQNRPMQNLFPGNDYLSKALRGALNGTIAYSDRGMAGESGLPPNWILGDDPHVAAAATSGYTGPGYRVSGKYP